MVPGSLGKGSSRRSATTILAPSSARDTAMTLPIPPALPVTTTTLSFRSMESPPDLTLNAVIEAGFRRLLDLLAPSTRQGHHHLRRRQGPPFRVLRLELHDHQLFIPF